MFENLQQFEASNGHCRPPAHHSKLGNWVMFQRRYYALGKLNQDQIERLESIGFQWRLQTHSKPRLKRVTEVADTKFKDMMDKLQTFRDEHGHCSVPVKYDRDPSLGFWVKKQRNLKSSNQLRPDREQMLNAIGFQWSGRRQAAQQQQQQGQPLIDGAPPSPAVADHQSTTLPLASTETTAAPTATAMAATHEIDVKAEGGDI